MGFSFRKSFKIGAVRVNVSNRGVGASAGAKGARLGVNSAGRRYTSLSIPGTGLRYTAGGGGRGRRRAVDDRGVEYLENDDGTFEEIGGDNAEPVGFFRRVIRGIGLAVILLSLLAGLIAFFSYRTAGHFTGEVAGLTFGAVFLLGVGRWLRR